MIVSFWLERLSMLENCGSAWRHGPAPIAIPAEMQIPAGKNITLLGEALRCAKVAGWGVWQKRGAFIGVPSLGKGFVQRVDGAAATPRVNAVFS
jgi:hypothetical protein